MTIISTGIYNFDFFTIFSAIKDPVTLKNSTAKGKNLKENCKGIKSFINAVLATYPHGKREVVIIHMNTPKAYTHFSLLLFTTIHLKTKMIIKIIPIDESELMLLDQEALQTSFA